MHCKAANILNARALNVKVEAASILIYQHQRHEQISKIGVVSRQENFALSNRYFIIKMHERIHAFLPSIPSKQSI